MALLTGTLAEDSKWGGLYPRESGSREVKSLDGLWNFRLAPLHDPLQGFREEWFLRPLSKTGSVISMAVPSSYNDVTQDKALRDHIGWAWYDRTFYVPVRWQTDKQRVVLRLGSAHYNSIIYINGVAVTSHEGGHLPIMAEISSGLRFGKENLVTVAINNTLTPSTLPQGKIVYHNDPTKYPPGYFEQTLDFDFFNYAGLHRPVYLYTTPQTYIDDIVVNTDIDGSAGIINYKIFAATSGIGPQTEDNVGCSVKLLDNEGDHVTSAMGCVGTIKISNASLWWPYLMHSNPGYMYTLMAAVSDEHGVLDLYPQKGSSLDVILVNRYFSWYSDTGHLELIYNQTVNEFMEWHLLHNKPVMISEYGAGSIAGFHMDPSFTWTEEYQADLMVENFKAFDTLRSKGYFFGEMIWNFADFSTPMEYNRPGACMKGLFTRARQPKMAGHLMRMRYWSLAQNIHNVTIPKGVRSPLHIIT
ncbi:Beta-glucuronidase [Penaeus vannamei]|uniref:Beta-glucuronidase n=1 Tax=Penaeus vannamei TaxID=6689 RepID=A0A3R7SXU2_PENVA|nr:Beta-glucuronidase [Penaeus vannamei]